MTFAEKLRGLRKQAGFSQEKLAEKLGVSRQAITKWETDGGTPDMENVMAISTLFGISLDELLSGEKPKQEKHLFESVTEYDIDRRKRYDLKLGGAKQVCITGYEGEKLRVKLASDQLPGLQSDCKVKIDDGRDCIDLDISRRKGLTVAMAKETVYIEIFLPQKYIYQVEVDVCTESIAITDLECEEVELDGKCAKLSLEGVRSKVEVNCDLDMEITCRDLLGTVELNQISATSRLTLPEGYPFRAAVKGLGNSIGYEKNGVSCDDLSDAAGENAIKLNGMNSELLIAVQA